MKKSGLIVLFLLISFVFTPFVFASSPVREADCTTQGNTTCTFEGWATNVHSGWFGAAVIAVPALSVIMYYAGVPATAVGGALFTWLGIDFVALDFIFAGIAAGAMADTMLDPLYGNVFRWFEPLGLGYGGNTDHSRIYIIVPKDISYIEAMGSGAATINIYGSDGGKFRFIKQIENQYSSFPINRVAAGHFDVDDSYQGGDIFIEYIGSGANRKKVYIEDFKVTKLKTGWAYWDDIGISGTLKIISDPGTSTTPTGTGTSLAGLIAIQARNSSASFTASSNNVQIWSSGAGTGPWTQETITFIPPSAVPTSPTLMVFNEFPTSLKALPLGGTSTNATEYLGIGFPSNKWYALKFSPSSGTKCFIGQIMPTTGNYAVNDTTGGACSSAPFA